MNSSKPEPTPKKISNKRVKRKHSDIDEDTTDPASVPSDDGYKGDSESSNITMTVSANVNKDEIDTQTFECLLPHSVQLSPDLHISGSNRLIGYTGTFKHQAHQA